MRWPHYTLWLSLVLTSGCGSARTLSHEEAEQERAAIAQRGPERRNESKGSHRVTEDPVDHAAAADIPETPIYDAPIETVHHAVIRACQKKYGKVDVSDRAAHHVMVDYHNAWTGDSIINIQLTENEKKTRVDIDVHEGPNGSVGNRSNHVLRDLIREIQTQMDPAFTNAAPAIEDRLRSLEDLHAKGLVTDTEYQAKREQILADL